MPRAELSALHGTPGIYVGTLGRRNTQVLVRHVLQERLVGRLLGHHPASNVGVCHHLFRGVGNIWGWRLAAAEFSNPRHVEFESSERYEGVWSW